MLVKAHISGLKCDKPGCDWRDDDVRVEHYSLFLNHPCPICGSNILTDADFRHVNTTLTIVNFINRWFGWIPTKTKKFTAITHVSLNGSGKAKIRIEQLNHTNKLEKK